MIELKNGKWFGLHICKSCEEPLKEYDVKHSNGVCPECGVRTPFSTNIGTDIVILKYVENGNIFFRDGSFVSKEDDDFAFAWLEKFGHQLKFVI